MYYYKLINNYVFKYEISFNVIELEKTLYNLALKFGKMVHTRCVTYKPVKDKNKVYAQYSVKFFDYDKDGKIMYEVCATEIIKPDLYKLIERCLNQDSLAIDALYNYNVINDGDVNNIDYYYKKFQESFKFNFIDKMNVDEYNKARRFMNLSEIEKNKKRVISRKRGN